MQERKLQGHRYMQAKVLTNDDGLSEVLVSYNTPFYSKTSTLNTKVEELLDVVDFTVPLLLNTSLYI